MGNSLPVKQKEIYLVLLVKLGERKKKGGWSRRDCKYVWRWGVVAVVSDLFITIHLTLSLAIWLFNDHYDSDDLLMFIIHDHIGKINSLKESQLREA